MNRQEIQKKKGGAEPPGVYVQSAENTHERIQYNNIAFFFMTGKTETEQKNTRVGWGTQSGSGYPGKERVYEVRLSLCECEYGSEVDGV
jgi:hypothetical protein